MPITDTDRELKLAKLTQLVNDFDTEAGYDRRPIEQRLDRVSVGLDNIYEAVGALLAKLQPVLGPVPDSPQDGAVPDINGTSAVTRQIAVLSDNAHHLADKIRAIAVAVEL